MIQPNPNETQPEFAIRFHEQMANEIPDTEARDAAMVAAWREAHPSDELHERASRKAGEDYERRGESCIFSEHETQDKQGQPVVWGRDELIDALSYNNERIADTGMLGALTEGHTPDREAMDRGAEMPPVLGYAGPYRLGMIGARNPRWAIFATEWHHKPDRDRLSRLRRRSVEVWTDKSTNRKVFDPIAALGAETPRLDLGMHYTRDGAGRDVVKYAGPVFPSAASVAVPGEDDDRTRNQADPEGGPMLDERDIDTIIEKLMATAPMQWVASQMTTDAPDPGVDAPAEAAAPADAPAAPADAPPAEPVADAPPADAPPVAAAADEPETASRYECDEDDKAMMSRYMAGEVEDDEFTKYMAGKRQRYQADDAADNPKEGQDVTTATDDLTKRAADVADDQKYSRLQARLEAAEAQLTEQRREKIRTERYSRVMEIGATRAIDVKAEVAQCCDLDKMSDDEFTRHIATIERYSERNGVGAPTLYAPPLESGEDPRNVERYAREAVDETLRRQEAGEKVTYDVVLAEVKKRHAG